MSKLADDHWNYVAEVLRSHGETEVIIEKCGFHYRTAIAHGYKHGVEDMAEKAKEALRKETG